MNVRGGKFIQGQDGQGRGRGIYGGRRSATISTVTSRKKGLFYALGDNIFTYNEKRESDQPAITFRNIFKHIETVYRQEISNEIQNQTAVIIIKLIYDQDLLDKHVIEEGWTEANFKRIQDARRYKEAILQVDLNNDPYLDITLTELQK